MGRIAKWRQLSDEEFAQKVKESRSFMDLAKQIGYTKFSGNVQEKLKIAVKEKGLDTSHFTGQGWNKDNYDYSTFINGTAKKNGISTLKALINLRGHKCEQCGLSQWLNQPINLEVHHIDGNHYNNELTNLILLCPNCHSYTSNYRGRNNTGKMKVTEEEFVQALQDSNNILQALKKLNLSAGSGNYQRANELIIKYQITKFLKRAPEQETLCVNTP